MTPKQEYEKLRELGFAPINPFKLNEMSKTANKIVNLLTSNKALTSYCYEDMKIIMEIVSFTIDEGKGEKSQDGFTEYNDIESARKSKGLTQLELAKKSDLKYDSVIRKYESGRVNAKAETLAKIANGLEMELRYKDGKWSFIDKAN